MTNHSLIEQIDNLGLPKRRDKRRYISVGQKYKCWLSYGGRQLIVDVIDLSFFGLAFLLPSRHQMLNLKKNDLINLKFARQNEKPFKVCAKVSHIEKFESLSKNYTRIGVNFQRKKIRKIKDFRQTVSQICTEKLGIFGHFIDSNFFSERYIVQFTAITDAMIEVIIPSTSHGFLPNHEVSFTASLPGFGQIYFSAIAENSSIYCGEDEYRMRLKLAQGSEDIRSAIASLLLAQSPQTSIEQIKSLQPRANFTSVFFTSKTTTTDFVSTKITQKISLSTATNRWESYYTGNRLVGRVQYGFFSGNIWSSVTNKTLKNYLNSQASLGILDLELHQELTFEDLALNLIQHMIQASVNSQIGVVWIALPAGKNSTWIKFGFRLLEQPNPSFELYFLPVKTILTNRDQAISKKNWDKWYKPLATFFQDRTKRLKTASM